MEAWNHNRAMQTYRSRVGCSANTKALLHEKLNSGADPGVWKAVHRRIMGGGGGSPPAGLG